MADEINMTARLEYSKNNISITKSQTKNIDVSGNVVYEGVQQITSVANQVLDFAQVPTTSAGICFLRNMGTSNDIDLCYDNDASRPYMRLKAGEFAMFRLHPSAESNSAMTASTASSNINLEITVVQN